VVFMQGNQAQEAISESEEALEEIRKGGEDE
jgi:GTP cyclohydrolase III